MTVSAQQTIPIVFDTVRAVAGASITGTFAAVGAAFTYPARIIKVGNTTNDDLEISFDGTNPHDRLPPNSFAVYDMSAAHASPGYSAMQEQISIYVRYLSGETTPTGGYFWCTVIRGKF